MKLIKENRKDQEKFRPKDPTPPTKLQAKKLESSKKVKKARKEKKKNHKEW